MYGRIILVTAVIGLYVVTDAIASLEIINEQLVGSNVCMVIKAYTETVSTTEYKILMFKKKSFCMFLRCFTKSEKAVPYNVEKIKECCEGYERTPDGTHCLPVCKIPCVRGVCIMPNVCLCEKYYEGRYCNISIACPPGTYGYECMQTCYCQNNGTCDPLSGACSCLPGYTGKNCESPCPSYTYGYECKNKCNCENGGTCDRMTGICSCQPGYAGKYCESTCPLGFYGHKCQGRCECEDNALCDPASGACKYPKDIMDNIQFMNNRNKSRTYGRNREKNCICNWHKADSCNPKTGECICKHKIEGVCHCVPGWTGDDCKTVCPPGTYGINCRWSCKCENEAICRPSDGVCLCKPGFYGTTCSKVCPNNYYGEMCLHRCACNANTEICDSHVGCVCDISRPNNTCITALQIEAEDDTRTLILDMSIILSCLIMSIICALLLILCYFYYYRRKMHNSKRLIRNNVQNQTSTGPDENVAGISTGKMCHCDKNAGNPMLDSKTQNSYSNESFFIEFKGNDDHGYDTNEHIYYEICEFASERTEDPYDHLDFLRPTGSWKPHYQNKSVLRDKNSNSSSSNSSNVGENTI